MTKQERLILIFLASTALIGLGSNHFIKTSDLEGPRKLLYPMDEKMSAGRIEKPININTANLNELIRLKGIGVATAQRIIDYRRRHGRFFFKEDIKKVKGIGFKKFDLIKKWISVK